MIVLVSILALCCKRVLKTSLLPFCAAMCNGVKLIMVVGMKTGRWPECHLPGWVTDMSKEERESEVLEYLQEMVLRYGGSSTIISWQIENEPFFPFGECPWYDKEFLGEEIRLVKSLSERPVIISDTGEWSLWFRAAKLGDIVGTTMYRRVWAKDFKFYFTSFL